MPSAGTDSAFYRLRPDLAVRLPRRPGTTGVRRAIDALRGAIDVEALTTAWETAFRAAEWPGAPVWIHGAWAGARGWASSIALIALPSYLQTKPVVVAASRRLVSAVVADHRRGAS